MARVLVTGGSGFIGLHLVKSLAARGDQVTCLVRGSSQVEPLKQLGASLAVGDVTDPKSLADAVRPVDVVYHLAGLTKANSRAAYDRVNRDGVEHLLAACASRPSPPVTVVLSSLSAAGPTLEAERPRVESDPPLPASNYGRSKRAGEVAAESWAHAVPITVVRPPVVIGQGDRLGFALFHAIRRFRAFSILGRGRRVSVIHVSDLVPALIAAAEHGERLPTNGHFEKTADQSTSGQGCYFVAADENPWFPDLSRMIARAVGRPGAWAIRLPEATLWVVGACGQAVGQIAGRANYLNLDRAREITAGHWTCSAAKAREQLRVAPGASLEERVRETAQWYRDEGWI